MIALTALSLTAGAQGTITGAVVAESTRRPLAGVDVTIVGDDGAASRPAVTDRTGRFRLAVPPSASFRLMARRPGYEILTTVPLTAETATAGRLELVLRPARRDVATLVRGVVADSTGRAIPFALVRIGSGVERVTDDSGRFDVAVRAASQLAIAVRRVGYRPLELTLPRVPDTLLSLVMRPLAGTLATVHIEADETVRALEMGGFYQRLRAKHRGANTGHFIAPEDIQRHPVGRTSQLIQGIPGVSVLPISPKDYAVFGTNRCPMTVYIDRVRISSLSRKSAMEFDSVISPTSVAGIEVYARANMPDEYRALNGTCGVILIWSK